MNQITSWTWDSVYPAPAKLNLACHGRRDNGYHELQTLFRFLDFADALRFAPEGTGRIVLTTHKKAFCRKMI